MSGGAGYTSEPAQMMHGFSYLWWGTPDPAQQMGAYTAESAPIAHETWLTDGGVAWTPAHSVFTKGLAAIAANPYDGVSAYSPTVDLAALTAKYDTAMVEIVKLVLGENDWKALLLEGVVGSDAYIDGIIVKALASIDSSVVDDEVDEFESSVDKDYLRSLSRFAGGMVDVNAVCGSAFIMGMALMENERAGAVRKYRTGLRKELYQLIIQVHSKFTAQAIEDMLITMRARAAMELDGTKVSIDIMRTGAVVKSDKILQDADIDRSEALWPLQVHEEIASILNSVTGASVLPERQPAWKSSLSGAVSGAAAGALVGSSVPGIGTGIGAGIGAALGALTAQSS